MNSLGEVIGTPAAQPWACGCEDCRYGLIYPPPVDTTVPLYILRAVQMKRNMLTFCTCRAGHMRRQHLRRVLSKIESGDEKIPRAMGDEIDRYLKETSGVPTVRYVAPDGREIKVTA